MAACRLASKGKTMADSSYDMEVKSILTFLNMQRPVSVDQVDSSNIDVHPEELIAPRYMRKHKTKQVCKQLNLFSCLRWTVAAAALGHAADSCWISSSCFVAIFFCVYAKIHLLLCCFVQPTNLLPFVLP